MSENNKTSRPQRQGMGGGPGAMMMGGAKAKDFKGSMRRLASYLRDYKLKIGVVILFCCR